jgi:hypothetical protein
MRDGSIGADARDVSAEHANDSFIECCADGDPHRLCRQRQRIAGRVHVVEPGRGAELITAGDADRRNFFHCVGFADSLAVTDRDVVANGDLRTSTSRR